MKSQNCIDTISSPIAPAGPKLPPWLGSALRYANHWLERSRQRRQLYRLNDAALKDIGLTRADVQTESEKPFWQP